MEQNLLLILLLRIGFMAALASIVAALRPFREVLTLERKAPIWRIARVLFETTVLAAGVYARMSISSHAADLSLEGCFLMGWTHGPWTGLAVGLTLGGIEVFGGYWAPLIMLPIAGMAAGQLALYFPETAGWSAGTRVVGRKVAQDTAVCISALMMLVGVWIVLSIGNLAPKIIPVNGVLIFTAVIMSSVLCVVTPMYIWRGLRMEAELERRMRQMEKIKMESLMERFRPHFLFNTLGAIVSLMRTDVDGARNMTLKLAGLLRRSLSGGEGFVPFREEMKFARDYLDIESIRHGERLKVKEIIDPAALDVPVPRMVLQPLIENAILHGIDPKVEGGTLTIRANKAGSFLNVVVSDNGVGIDDPPREGIGLSNLRARLETAFVSGEAKLQIENGPEGGARAALWIPLERNT